MFSCTELGDLKKPPEPMKFSRMDSSPTAGSTSLPRGNQNMNSYRLCCEQLEPQHVSGVPSYRISANPASLRQGEPELCWNQALVTQRCLCHLPAAHCAQDPCTPLSLSSGSSEFFICKGRNTIPQVYAHKNNSIGDWNCFQFTPSDVESRMHLGLHQTRRLFPCNCHQLAKASSVPVRKGAGE